MGKIFQEKLHKQLLRIGRDVAGTHSDSASSDVSSQPFLMSSSSASSSPTSSMSPVPDYIEDPGQSTRTSYVTLNAPRDHKS